MALTVTDKIKSILATQKRNESLGAERVLSLLDEVRRQIIAELVSMPAGSYSAYYLQSSLSSIQKHLVDWESTVTRELGAGLTNSWEAGQSLLPMAAEAAGMALRLPWISTHTLDALKDFTFGKISGVSGDLFNKIKGELTLGVLGQKTPQEIAGQLAEAIKDHKLPVNKWGSPIFKSAAERAEVITGLEMGRAFSIATELSIAAAQETLPDLKRMWLHAGHPNAPRQSHLHMHGQVRKVGAAFYDTSAGAKVFYPRDPQAPISEVIRCGCTHIPWHPDFGSAESFKNDFDEKQEAANKPKRLNKQQEA